MNKLAIIGGSGLYNIDGIKDEKWLNVDTPWGKPFRSNFRSKN